MNLIQRNILRQCVLSIAAALVMISGVQADCTKENRNLVERLLYKGFSGGNMEVIEDIFSADIHFEDPMFPSGIEGIKALVKKNNSAMSNWKFVIDDMFCAREKAAVRWRATGVHTGSFMHEKPTGNPVELKGIVIYEIRNQKITRDWLMSDNLGFLTQIGVLSHEKVDMTK